MSRLVQFRFNLACLMVDLSRFHFGRAWFHCHGLARAIF